MHNLLVYDLVFSLLYLSLYLIEIGDETERIITPCKNTENNSVKIKVRQKKKQKKRLTNGRLQQIIKGLDHYLDYTWDAYAIQYFYRQAITKYKTVNL